MENGMTNEQFNKVLKMIIQIIEDSKTKEEAVEKIKNLLKQSRVGNESGEPCPPSDLFKYIIFGKSKEDSLMEIKENIKKLLETDISSYEINRKTGVTRQLIDKYRKEPNTIGRLTLDNALALSKYYETIKKEHNPQWIVLLFLLRA